MLLLYSNQKIENEDEPQQNTNDAGASVNCDINIDTTAQNEMQNRYIKLEQNYKANNILLL